MTDQAGFPVEPDLSPKDAARLSGSSYWLVLEEIRRGHLPAFRRPGGRLAIRRSDYMAWAYGDPVKPDPATEQRPSHTARRARQERDRSVAAILDLEERRRAS